MQRKIIHIDMDAFFASIEQLDNPHLRGRPVIVGGAPDKRGVVSTCSYEARRFGIRSAMPTSRALRLCPQAILISPHFPRYRKVSSQIFAIFAGYTPLVEPLSIDEAYLDVTHNLKQNPSATLLAEQIKRQILQETGLTASAGVSFNKFLAKIASGWEKPNGLTVIPPDEAEAFVDRLPIGKFPGIGPVTEKKMHSHNVHTGGELRRLSLEELTSLFGKAGNHFYQMARCIDERAVCPARVRKSLGKEITLPEDTDDLQEIHAQLRELAERLEKLIAAKALAPQTLCLKIRYSDFTTVTRQTTANAPISEAETLLLLAKELLKRTDAGRREVRLIGLSVSHFR